MNRSRRAAFGIAVCALSAVASADDVDLTLAPTSPAASVGDLVEVQLIASTSRGAPTEPIAAMDVILGWDPAALQLLGFDDAGGGPFLATSFPIPDPFNLNEADPPADGDALFTALSSFGSPFEATADGALVVTFQFEALAPGQTTIELLAEAGSPPGETIVFSAAGPNINITGEFTPGVVAIGASCPEDLNLNGTIESGDLNILLGAFAATDAGDIDGDGDTDSTDLNLLLAVFGDDCP